MHARSAMTHYPVRVMCHRGAGVLSERVLYFFGALIGCRVGIGRRGRRRRGGIRQALCTSIRVAC